MYGAARALWTDGRLVVRAASGTDSNGGKGSDNLPRGVCHNASGPVEYWRG